MLSFRPVSLADRAAMLDICATVWEGHDYLPRVFELWVNDPVGQFVAAELDGRMVAFSKLSWLAPGEYWLEGLRVHPDYRGRRLASQLHDHLVQSWRALAAGGTLRLVTESPAVLHAAERTGFTTVLTFAFAEAPALDEPSPLVPVEPAELERACSLVYRTPLLAETHGLVDLGWKWRAFTAEYAAAEIDAGRLYRWPDWSGVLLVTDLNREAVHTDRLLIQFPGRSDLERPEVWHAVRGLAHTLGKSVVRWCPPARPALLEALRAAGFDCSPDDREYCLELRA